MTTIAAKADDCVGTILKLAGLIPDESMSHQYVDIHDVRVGGRHILSPTEIPGGWDHRTKFEFWVNDQPIGMIIIDR
jgi:hypothetical protein